MIATIEDQCVHFIDKLMTQKYSAVDILTALKVQERRLTILTDRAPDVVLVKESPSNHRGQVLDFRQL